MEVNKIYNEDCTITMVESIDPKSINVILTSPPYNMTKRKGGYADKQLRYDEYNDWKTPKDYIKWTINKFILFDKILHKHGVILYNFSYSIENPSLPYQLISSIIEMTDFTIADTIIWKKPISVPHPASYNRLNRIFEFIFVFCRKNEILSFETNKKIVKISPKNQNYYEIITNFVEAKNNDGSNHLNKATYSTELCDKLLRIYAKPNSIIYDPFIGTGTTAISCIKLNLKYLGSEISEKQVEYANNWINKINSQTKLNFEINNE
jgi:site-specific DNA-methyltransferase (adenine-specific)